VTDQPTPAKLVRPDDGGPAFGSDAWNMSYRAWLAGKLLAAEMARDGIPAPDDSQWQARNAAAALAQADTLIARLREEGSL
jgi:hypothetical protein